MSYQFITVNTEPRKEELIRLLQANRLPVDDLDESKELYAVIDEHDVLLGCGGLEYAENTALVRSVAVSKDARGKGLGWFINQELEKIAVSKGISSLFLLTTTAKDFFEKQGYKQIDREEAPETIKATAEFSSLCPASAIVMVKNVV
jgi:amino-acid N-acetyltransferase